ncbi:MAG: penicillin-binding transpeptidase domain-containing protein, partial [Vicinamibacteria bacterium]|nr:penicillin-binding transpeptidase domain-containing protein [Vicinamibacteria bacterium]
MRLSRAALALTVMCAFGWASLDLARAAAPQASKRRRPGPSAATSQVVYSPHPSARDLQIGEAARKAIGRRAAGAVALDPWTGRVIAIANPRYAVLNAYQPCSVFKLVVALAGLSEGAITPQTRLTCDGGCWMWPGHGPIDLRRAIGVSCNPYFEQIGEKIGWEKVERYGRLLGLGSPSGLNLKGESAGKLPDTVRPSHVGHTSSHGAGVRTTALQLGLLVAATLNGGTLWQPQLAADPVAPRARWTLPAGAPLAELWDGYASAVSEGSAAPAFDTDLVVGGKTGSCSGVGWFASFAPAARPEFVLVTFVRGGNGSRASALAGAIYREAFGVGAVVVDAGSGG